MTKGLNAIHGVLVHGIKTIKEDIHSGTTLSYIIRNFIKQLVKGKTVYSPR